MISIDPQDLQDLARGCDLYALHQVRDRCQSQGRVSVAAALTEVINETFGTAPQLTSVEAEKGEVLTVKCGFCPRVAPYFYLRENGMCSICKQTHSGRSS